MDERECCKRVLLSTLRHPSLAPDATGTCGHAAYHVAVSLGKCRLYGVDLKEYDGVLRLKWIKEGAGWFVCCVTSVQEKVDDPYWYLEDWEQADYEEYEPTADELKELADDKARYLINERMDLWAAYLAFDESYQAALKRQSPNISVYAQSCLAASAALAVLDPVLKSCIQDRDTYQIREHIRKALVEPWCGDPPWWLV